MSAEPSGGKPDTNALKTTTQKHNDSARTYSNIYPQHNNTKEKFSKVKEKTKVKISKILETLTNVKTFKPASSLSSIETAKEEKLDYTIYT